MVYFISLVLVYMFMKQRKKPNCTEDNIESHYDTINTFRKDDKTGINLLSVYCAPSNKSSVSHYG